jgi:hypothetical protein
LSSVTLFPCALAALASTALAAALLLAPALAGAMLTVPILVMQRVRRAPGPLAARGCLARRTTGDVADVADTSPKPALITSRSMSARRTNG